MTGGKGLKNKAWQFTVDTLFDLAGGAIFALALSCFIAPAQIAPGGVSGLSIIFNYLTKVPIGILNMALNIPLLLLAWCFLGRGFTLKTLKSVLIQSVLVDLATQYLPVYGGEEIMAALFGGVGVGVGLALIFMRGSTTGGTDIVSRLIQLKFRHLSMGKLLFMVDVMVLLISVAVFQNIETGLYGMITIYTTGKILDSILYGLNTGKLILIISQYQEKIGAKIMEQIGRGVTLLHAQGGYSGGEKKIILCAVRAAEYHKVEEIIKEYDPDAFTITLEASEILGEGFQSITADKVT